LPENHNLAWETRKETTEIFKTFLAERLKIEDPENISLVDLHRLPQRTIIKNNVKINRPVIFKLNSSKDKRWILSRLKHLKAYNTELKKV